MEECSAMDKRRVTDDASGPKISINVNEEAALPACLE
jgi:hypothetical protein